MKIVNRKKFILIALTLVLIFIILIISYQNQVNKTQIPIESEQKELDKSIRKVSLNQQDITNRIKENENRSCYNSRDSYPKIIGMDSYNELNLQEICFCSDNCPAENWHVIIRYENITSPEECAYRGGRDLYDAAWKGYIGCIPDVGSISDQIKHLDEFSWAEYYHNVPANIVNIHYVKGETTVLSLDFLTHNPDFQPGVTDFFINQNLKLRDFTVMNETKYYKCGSGLDGNDTTPDVRASVEYFISFVSQELLRKNTRLSFYFYITGNTVKNIYQQCLP